MDAHSHNLLESYYDDGGGNFHYNSLQSGDSFFTVSFNRTVSSSGINITINSITNVGGGAVTDTDTAFLTNEVNGFQNVPLNGYECQTLGWTYLGHTSTNADNINAAIAAATASGYSFSSLFYHTGYFVHGCADTKQFYDQNT